ncbi:MAG: TetR/AcrR family transcriptional regulator [Candidatus Scatomorpha sp.]|jgi:AcrR family transcriptional regulator
MSRTPEQFKVTEEEILDVSLKHFSMHGYEGTNLNDIANELNITRTPIYYYFNNKLGLYESVTKRHLLSKKAQYTSIFTSDLPFFEKVRKDLLVSSHLRLSEQVLFAGIDTNPKLAEARDIQNQVMREIHEMKTENIRKAVADKILRPDTDVEQFMIYFYVISLGIEAVDKQTEYEITEERMDKLVDTVLDGIISKYKAI